MLNEENGTKKRRVVITGMGAVTPLGHSMAATWSGICEGRSPAAALKRFDGSLYAANIAYEVRDFTLNTELLSSEQQTLFPDVVHFGMHAAAEAIFQAGFQANAFNPQRTAVCVGVGIASPSYEWFAELYGQARYEDQRYLQQLGIFPDQLSAHLAKMINAQAGVVTVHTACASSGQSIGEAYEMIAYGDCDVVLTGGADSMISPFYSTGFGLLGALSKRNSDPETASRPFDSGRDGFVLGEGACMLFIEEYEHAKARGASIIAEICGYGVTESAYRITDLHPEGTGPIEAMQFALQDAGLPSSVVGYVNAHGTSTQVNDRIEALAISRVFTDHDVFVSSSKSMTGHLISAAGAIELAICVMALKDQVLPPSLHVFDKDPACPIVLTPSQSTPFSMQYALSNSVGFGGSNTALVVGRGQNV